MALEKNITDRAVDVACRRWVRTNPAGAASWEGMSPNRQDLLIHRMAGVVEALRDNDLLATPERDAEPTVYDEVRAERERAHAKHGEHSMEAQAVDAPIRMTILMEEVGEVAREFNEAQDGSLDRAALRAELVQVAAMAAAWADRIEAQR